MVKAKETKKVTTKGKKETGKEKVEKDPNAPKRALSSYIIFSKDQQDELKDVKGAERMKVIGARWKALSDEEKKKYNEKAEADKLRYAEEMKNYKPDATNGKRKKDESDDEEGEEKDGEAEDEAEAEDKPDKNSKKGAVKKAKETTTKKAKTETKKPALLEKLGSNFDLKRYLSLKKEGKESPSSKKGRG